jgi:hypothetical protein
VSGKRRAGEDQRKAMLGMGKVGHHPIDQLPLAPAAASSVKSRVLTLSVSTEAARHGR